MCTLCHYIDRKLLDLKLRFRCFYSQDGEIVSELVRTLKTSLQTVPDFLGSCGGGGGGGRGGSGGFGGTDFRSKQAPPAAHGGGGDDEEW